MAPETTGERGAHAEAFVAQYLCERGCVILARNYRIRAGEVDIIASKGDVGMFVEVKMRATEYFNTSEVITPSKIRKIQRAARYFLAEHGSADKAWRFDVALVGESAQGFTITYIENAFYADEHGGWQ